MNGQAMHEGDKVTMNGMEWEVISVYTRKQAIADGVLVDLTRLFPNDTRIYKYPVACTMAVWQMIEDACHKVETEEHTEVSLAEAGGIVWDLCWMSTRAIVKDLGNERLFKCCVPIGTKERLFKVHIGPGDDYSPVITIMLPDED